MSQYICDHRGVHEISGSTLRQPDAALIAAWGGGTVSESGVAISPQVIRSHIPILQGITIIAGDCGMLPRILKKRVGERTSEDTTHVAYQLAAEQANPIMTADEFIELMIHRAILWGNSVAAINRSSLGSSPPLAPQFGGLVPLPPETTQPWMDERGAIWIKTRITTAPGQSEERYYDPMDTIHIRGLTHDGFWGLSLQEVAKDTIGYGISLRQHNNYSARNGAAPRYVIKHPGLMEEEDVQEFRRLWQEAQGGPTNQGKIGILTGGMEVQAFGQTNEQAQMIDLMKLSVEDSSRILNIPPHMLNLLDRATFNNIEEQGRAYINRTLGRWQRKITQEFRLKLLTKAERSRYFFEYNNDQLLKGTLKDRAEALSKLIASRVLNPNEARETEGWDPYDGGQEYGNPNIDTRRQREREEPNDIEENGNNNGQNGHRSLITRW